MAGRIPEDLIEEVRGSTDLVDLVSTHVRLKRSGRNFVALCPFHEEKTPSFVIRPERQTYHCFGCGEGGNAFTFLMTLERLDFPEAVRSLADRAGIPMRYEGGNASSRDARAAVYRALAFARDFYHRHLRSPAGSDALAYLHGRGIRDESIEAFGLGFAPDAWEALRRAAVRQGFSNRVLEAAGLVKAGRDATHYDRFRRRILFPITDLQDRVIGFGARALRAGDTPKYLNSPETPVFGKSRVLYGLAAARDEIRRRGEAAVGEGYTDVIAAHQNGVREMVATLGTSLTREHARLLRRFTDRVVLVFDADQAGARASKRGVEKVLDEDLEVRVARLPGGGDPCDYVLERGGEALRAVLEGAEGFFEFLIGTARSQLSAGSVHGTTRAVEGLLEIVARVRNPVRQGLFLRKLSEEFGVREDSLREAMRGRPWDPGSRRSEVPASPGPGERAERDLLEAMASREEIFEELRERIGADFFQVPAHRKLAQDLEHRRGAGPGAAGDLEGLLAASRDPEVARLVTFFLRRARSGEDYRHLARGALRYFERDRLKSDLRGLAAERREALARGDEASINRLLERTFETIRREDLSRRNPG